MSAKKRYAQVGLGGRHRMFTDALRGDFKEHGEMVGVCDVNPGRLRLAQQDFEAAGMPVPGFEADQFDEMIRQTRPDAVIVTTKDSMHDAYICRAMELGRDAITENRCVFSDTIDIEDSMQAVVRYAGGATMSYSLQSFLPCEGYHVIFNGSRGRLEHRCEESVYINADGTVPGALKKEGTWTRIYPHWQPAYEVDIWTGSGGHGGGDQPLLQDVLLADPPADKYRRAADQRAGAWSIMTGVAANESIARGAPVRIDELVSGIAWPDYPPMPAPDEPLTFPEKKKAKQ